MFVQIPRNNDGDKSQRHTETNPRDKAIACPVSFQCANQMGLSQKIREPPPQKHDFSSGWSFEILSFSIPLGMMPIDPIVFRRNHQPVMNCTLGPHHEPGSSHFEVSLQGAATD